MICRPPTPVTISLRKLTPAERNDFTVPSRSETSRENRFPPARTGWRAIRHRLPATATSAGCAQHETEVAAEEHRKRGRRAHLFAEPEAPAVEVET
jgi:hypothetical protein